MHVRGRTSRGYSVVCHFPIAAGNNDVGLAWRTAYARSKGALSTVLPDGDGTLGTISAAEKTSVTQATPTVAESVQEFQIPDDWGALNGPQRQALLDAWYAVASTEWTNGNAELLRFYGFTR